MITVTQLPRSAARAQTFPGRLSGVNPNCQLGGYDPVVKSRPDSDPELERQRAEVEAAFREQWVPLPGSEPQLLTERDYAEARRLIAQPGKTWVTPVAIEAVRDGARPGDPLPHDRFLGPTPNPEVIIIGRGSGRRVAVLFPGAGFPKVQFGHRFETEAAGGSREAAVRLIERIEAGALRQMMDGNPNRDSAGITWTPWGTPSSDPELEHQRAGIEAAFRDGWQPSGAGGSRVLTERAYAQARKVLDHGGWTGLDVATIQAVRSGAQPGAALPPHPFIRGVTDAEVVLDESGPRRRVAVLFCHEYFPGVRFGHRFPLEPFGEGHEDIWLMEEIDTGALHRMMNDPPPADKDGIVWTTWGSPATD